jgi:hypothetical protein
MTRMPGPPTSSPGNRPLDSMLISSSPPRALMTRVSKADTSTELLKPSALVTVTTPVADTVMMSFAAVPWMTTVVPVTVTSGTCR